MFEIGDEVRILDTEKRDYYKKVLNKKGKVVQITNYKHFEDDREHTKYYVEIPEYLNDYQSEGWWVFHDEMSISLISNEVTCDDQMDTYKYVMQYLNLTKAQHNRDYIIKGDKQNMINGILEIYEEKQLRKINKKYDELEQSIKLTDERYKVWLECTTTLNKLYAEDKIVDFVHANIKLSEATKKKLCTIVFGKREEELRKFYSKKAEVNAQLSMCETYEQKQEILRIYNIINKNGKING